MPTRLPERTRVPGPVILLIVGSLLPGQGCDVRDAGISAGTPGETSDLLYWQVDGVEPPAPHALAKSVSALAPDIAVLDLEDRADETIEMLRQEPGAWKDMEMLSGDHGALVLLSRFPIQTRHSAPEITYHMGGEERRMRYGILDVTIQLRPGSPLRVVAVAVKDKTFDPVGQSEMRRNELRLVTRHLQRLLQGDPHGTVILVGALNDDPDAAAMRGLTGGTTPLLQDLRPVDPSLDAWTSHAPGKDQYLRNHYALLRANSPFQSSIPNQPPLRRLSRHRPLLIHLAPLP